MATLRNEDAAMPSAAEQLEAEAEAGAGAVATMPSTRQTDPEKADAAPGTSTSASSETVVVPPEQEKTPEEHRSPTKTFLLMFPLAVSGRQARVGGGRCAVAGTLFADTEI
jgi:hypothetical protein